MPIYEFFCDHCQTVFNFLSPRVNTTTIPACPRCRGALLRQPALFRTPGRARAGEEGELAVLDPARMSGGLAELVAEAERCDDHDPRQMARVVRNFSARAGVALGEGMEAALAHLEAGGDPEGVEAELAATMGGEDNSPLFIKKNGLPRPRPPHRDETLYLLSADPGDVLA